MSDTDRKMDIKKFGCLIQVSKDQQMPWLDNRFQVTVLPVCEGCELESLVKVKELGGDGFIYLPQVPEGQPYPRVTLDKFRSMIHSDWMTENG